jgi:hypothetical protein
MAIKLLSKSQEQDIHCGLTKKIKFNRSRLNRWLKDNPEHPDKLKVIAEKTARIKELETLRKKFATPYAYE